MNAHEGLPAIQRYGAVTALALGIVMSVMDGAIANIALPTIGRELNTSAALSIWVVNGYQLAITVSLLPLAAYGDIIGYRFVYLAGLVVFTIASLACALSDSLAMLVLARFVQGLGAAGIMSVSGALVRVIYPTYRIGRGLAINTTVVAIAAAAGPTLAGIILSITHWSWLFAVNVPIGIIACIIAMRSLPHTPRAKHSFDGWSAALSAVTFGLLITSIDTLRHIQAKFLFIAEFMTFVAAAGVLIARQRDKPAPLLPVDLFKIPLFALSICTSICSFAAQMLAFISLPFLFQGAMGYSAIHAGLLVAPWPIAVGLISPFAGRLADRWHPGLLGGIGLLMFAGGTFGLAVLPAHPSVGDILWRMLFAGLGFGLFQSPNNRAIITSAPQERSGGASGMLATARLLGQSLGAALAALIFGRVAMHEGPSLALYIASGFAISASVVSFLRLSRT
jgi:DHA2 family multidrug resistance protein-like MFS transporter